MREGIIYRFVNNNLERDTDYYGSTFGELKKRRKDHKSDHNTRSGCIAIHEYFDKYGFASFTIEVVERSMFKDKPDILKREQYYIDNFPCCNKFNAWGINIKNKEKNIKIWNARPDVKQMKLDYSRRPEVKARLSERIQCECGLFSTRNHLDRHRKTQCHANRMAT